MEKAYIKILCLLLIALIAFVFTYHLYNDGSHKTPSIITEETLYD